MRLQHDNEKTAAHNCLRNGRPFQGSPCSAAEGEPYIR